MRGYRSVSVAGSQVRQFRAQSRRQTKTGTSFYNISRATMLTEAKKMSLTPQSRWLGYEIEGSTPSQGLSWQATDWAPRVARNRVHKWYPRLKNFDFIFLIKLIFLDCFFYNIGLRTPTSIRSDRRTKGHYVLVDLSIAPLRGIFHRKFFYSTTYLAKLKRPSWFVGTLDWMMILRVGNTMATWKTILRLIFS